MDITKEEAAEASAGAADAPVDYCARYEWYGDGECDTFCELPDPDCGGDAERCFEASSPDRVGCCELAAYDYCAEPTTPSGCGEALALRADGAQLVATVRDQGAIEHFLAKSTETFEETIEYSGERRTVTLERSFPWQVSVRGEPGARVLELEELRDAGEGQLTTSGPPGSEVTFLGTTATLVIRAAQMPTSRSVVYYEVGSWTFDCGEGPATVSCRSNAECGEGTRCNAAEVCLDPPDCEPGESCPDVCYGVCVADAG